MPRAVSRKWRPACRRVIDRFHNSSSHAPSLFTRVFPQRERNRRDPKRSKEKPMPKKPSTSVATAHDILRGQSVEPRELLELAKELKREKEFGLARRLLARARLEPSLNDDAALRLKVYQESALCTYKDPDLQADARLDRALDILRQSCEDINKTENQETLGLIGAIYKRKWELDNQTQQLERALNYYLRGYQPDRDKPPHPIDDQGYTGINAAFVLDLLAHQELEEAKKANFKSEIAQQRRERAKQIRQDIADQVAPLVDQENTNWLQGKWWFYATVAEAHFGIGNYEEAIRWLKRGEQDANERGIPIAPWEYESTARQLAWLARIQDRVENTAGVPGSDATKSALEALATFFGDQEIKSAYVGKVGLGLSGGGFRASLFHIGVLARLAELDVLHRVETLSCVSGGSIVGAHYYLEVRKLLESKPDSKITRQDYIDIVDRVRKDFLAGVQKNIRVRVVANPFINLKMFFTAKYSRTMRAGDLYESEIFSRVKDGAGNE